MGSCWPSCDSRESEDAVTSIALFPLNIVLFPEGPLPLRIFETRYLDMVRRCMREGQGFGVVLIREGREVGDGDTETYEVGTMAKITDFHQLPDGLLGLSCVGQQRFRIHTRSRQTDGLHLGEVEWLDSEPAMRVPPRHARLAELLRTVLPQLGEVYTGIDMRLDDAAWVGHRLAEILPIPLADKQSYLEIDDPVERLDVLAPLAPARRRHRAPTAGRVSHSAEPMAARPRHQPVAQQTVEAADPRSHTRRRGRGRCSPEECAAPPPNRHAVRSHAAMLPVSTRVRLKISPTASHAKNESNTSIGCPKGAKDRTSKSKPLPQFNSSGGMLALAKKCSIANSGAVSRAAVHGPDSRCDRGMHGAAKHRLFDQRDADAGGQADEQQAQHTRAVEMPDRRIRQDAQVRRQQESGAHGRRRDADRAPQQATLSGIGARAGRSPSRAWS